MSLILEKLKAARRKKGLRQSALGEKLGLPQSHISKIESCGTDPRLSTVTEMALLLDHQLVLILRQHLPLIRSLISGEGINGPIWKTDEDGGLINPALKKSKHVL